MRDPQEIVTRPRLPPWGKLRLTSKDLQATAAGNYSKAKVSSK